jgi:proline iminopeptidase
VRVDVGGVRLFVDVDGAKLVPDGPWMRERPTIVLVHSGPGFDHQVFKAQLGPQLSHLAQVVYFDLRGHGRSDPCPPEECRLDVWADDLAGLCAALSIERPVVLGHGFGGLVTLRFAARHPDRASALVLSAPYARLVPGRIVEAFDRVGGPEAGEAARRFYAEPSHARLGDYLRLCWPLLVRTPEAAEELTRSVFAAETFIEWTIAEGASFDLREEIAALTVPTLVVAGEDDPYTPLASAREVADSLPPGLVRFRSFPNARHPVFRDSDPEALDELRAFLEDLAPDGGSGAAEPA